MVRYYGRARQITGTVFTNQPGLKQAGCPGTVGKRGTIVRFLGRRVNCNLKTCGLPTSGLRCKYGVRQAIGSMDWNDARSSNNPAIPNYCHQVVNKWNGVHCRWPQPKNRQLAGGVGNIWTPRRNHCEKTCSLGQEEKYMNAHPLGPRLSDIPQVNWRVTPNNPGGSKVLYNATFKEGTYPAQKDTRRFMKLGYWGGGAVHSYPSLGGAPDFSDIISLPVAYDVIVLAFVLFSADYHAPPPAPPAVGPGILPSTSGKGTELGDPPNVNGGNLYMSLQRGGAQVSKPLDNLNNVNQYLIEPIKAFQNKSKPGFVLASVGGGQRPYVGPTAAVTVSAWVENMFRSWCAIASYYHLDGIDIDIENCQMGPGGVGDVTPWLYFLKKVSLGGWIVSIVPQLVDSYLGYGPGADNWNWNQSCGAAQTNAAASGTVASGALSADSYNGFLCTTDLPITVAGIPAGSKWTTADLDIISVQIYNNQVGSSNFVQLMNRWIGVFVYWSYGGDHPCGTGTGPVPPGGGTGKTIGTAPTYITGGPPLFNEIMTQITNGTMPSGSPPAYPPRDLYSGFNPNISGMALSMSTLARKIFMGFCGSDCQYDPLHVVHAPPLPLSTITNFLNFFRGIGVWAVDMPYGETPACPSRSAAAVCPYPPFGSPPTTSAWLAQIFPKSASP